VTAAVVEHEPDRVGAGVLAQFLQEALEADPVRQEQHEAAPAHRLGIEPEPVVLVVMDPGTEWDAVMGRHDQLSDKALSRLLVAGGLVRVAALAGIVLMQVAYPGMSLRLPLSVAALVLVALVVAAEFVLRREERRRWREKDERINRVLEDVRHRDRRDR
jgi:hypothetical protein